MFPRERGSNTTPAEHNPADVRCEKADTFLLHPDACCTICGEKLAREQAASVFAVREIGS